MFVMSSAIRIEGLVIPLITSASIKMDVGQLANTAIVEIPATAYRKRLSWVKDIRRGQRIEIWLGYDNRLELEFDGYINRRTDKDGGMVIECEDAMFMFRQTYMQNQELVNPSLKDILVKVCGAYNKNPERATNVDYTTSLKYKYSKFVFQNASAYDVLKKIQEETKARIYLDTLNFIHVEPQYIDTATDVVRYSFQRNICKDGLNLVWKDTKENPLLVEVEGSGKGADGKPVKVVKAAGTPGGDKVKEKIKGIIDERTLQSIADDMYNARNYEGFEGSFDAWLRPYVQIGDFVQLEDEEDSARNGKYYVKSVETSFSKDGGKRKITLGRKVR